MSLLQTNETITASEEEQLKAEEQKLAAILEKQKAFFATGITKNPSWRKEQLTKLYNSLCIHEQEIFDAINKDLFKSPYETYMTEIGIVKSEISYLKKRLIKWCKPKKVIPELTALPSTAKIYPDPYGLTLIMSPWNYPFMLTMDPLAGTIAAGNCAIVKPSRYSPATSAVIEKIVKEIYPPEYICVVQGGHLQNTALLNQHFNFIFFTGSVNVGKIVMQKASKFLTPVCLELGGKSPCIIHKDANIPLAARKCVWGKFVNSGQTCVAPDYFLVHEDVREQFIKCVYEEIKKQYTENPLTSNDYCKIINEKHFNRLMGLAPQAKNDPSTNKIAPTVIELGKLENEDGTINSHIAEEPVMKEELFGPLMPIISYKEINSVLEFVTGRDEPLALYLYTKNKKLEKKIISQVRYGSGCINDCLFQLTTSNLPFGGVGNSGMGSYHGKASFDLFTHYKSVLKKNSVFEPNIRFAPFEGRLNFIKKFVK